MEEKHVFGGILAGGIGSRMAGAGKPKQFLEVGGVPVLVHTLQKFLLLDGLTGIVIAMHRDWRDYTMDLLAKHGIDQEKITIVDGGPTRFESLVCLAKGCVAASEKLGGAGKIIMVNHDCARPFVPKKVLEANVTALESGEFDMVTTSMPTIDTVLISKDGKVGDVVPERSTVFLDQGPQTVDVGHFLSLVETLSAAERERYMEAGRLYMEKGFKVGIVPGDRLNFKLTTPFDLAVAERLIADGTVE